MCQSLFFNKVAGEQENTHAEVQLQESCSAISLKLLATLLR